MAGRHSSPFSRSLHFREHTIPLPHSSHSVEMGMRASSVSAAQYSHNAQRRQRHNNYLAIIESPLARLTDEALEIDVRRFQSDLLPCVAVEMLSRAVQVAKYIRVYDEVARSNDPGAGEYLPVQLTREEKSSLKKERDSLPSQPTMYVVILTVSLAAFLQGFVQSSINGASLFSEELGLDVMRSTSDRWKLGAVNASPFLFAALVGCWVALPINERFGRRGAMAIAASLILASSLGSAFCKDWKQLFGARVFNGIGMGIKAVSTPILASETAVGYWRGTSILAWQLWVAFGIAVGFGFNLIFYTAPETRTVLMLILGSPFVPSILLLVSLYFCPESPRYYLRRQSAHFNPEKAYYILLKLRGSELLALRDVYLIYKSTEREETSEKPDGEIQGYSPSRGFVSHLRAYVTQYKELFTKRRLRNAVMSSSIVALAQQLCGINVLAFYSGPQEVYLLKASGLIGKLYPMVYSLGFGAINFFFALPAIRTIDTLGRRKWLVLTLPLMCLFLTGAALATAFIAYGTPARDGIVTLFIFLFAATYSPGLGPIPFTLASESFPLSHREAGCAFAVATNLVFAGLLSIFFPIINKGLGNAGALGLFAGLNLIAFALVFLLVEETKRRSLEDLDAIFQVSKRKFTRYQVMEYLPWFFQHHVLGSDALRPELYLDLIWGNGGDVSVQSDQQDEVTVHELDGARNMSGPGLFAPGSPFHRVPEAGPGRASDSAVE